MKVSSLGSVTMWKVCSTIYAWKARVYRAPRESVIPLRCNFECTKVEALSSDKGVDSSSVYLCDGCGTDQLRHGLMEARTASLRIVGVGMVGGGGRGAASGGRVLVASLVSRSAAG